MRPLIQEIAKWWCEGWGVLQWESAWLAWTKPWGGPPTAYVEFSCTWLIPMPKRLGWGDQHVKAVLCCSEFEARLDSRIFVLQSLCFFSCSPFWRQASLDWQCSDNYWGMQCGMSSQMTARYTLCSSSELLAINCWSIMETFNKIELTKVTQNVSDHNAIWQKVNNTARNRKSEWV